MVLLFIKSAHCFNTLCLLVLKRGLSLNNNLNQLSKVLFVFSFCLSAYLLSPIYREELDLRYCTTKKYLIDSPNYEKKEACFKRNVKFYYGKKFFILKRKINYKIRKFVYE